MLEVSVASHELFEGLTDPYPPGNCCPSAWWVHTALNGGTPGDQEGADVFDRYRTRLREMHESVKIANQALERITPSGAFQVDDPKVVRLVDNAMQGALRGASLTQRMLAFARKQDLKPVVVDKSNWEKALVDSGYYKRTQFQ